MFQFQGKFAAASKLLLLNAVLHVMVFPLAGFSADSLIWVLVGIVFTAVIPGLVSGRRWLAYLVFVVLLADAIAALSSSFGLSLILAWWFIAMMAVDVLASVVLFWQLWNSQLYK